MLRRSVESALRTLVGVVDHAPGSPCHERHVQSIEHQSCDERGGHRPANEAGAEGVEHHREIEKTRPGKGDLITTAKSDGRQAPDLVERDFTASVPDRLWVADITYVPTVDQHGRCDRWITTGARCSEHGAHDTATQGRDPPLRPGFVRRIQLSVATRSLVMAT